VLSHRWKWVDPEQFRAWDGCRFLVKFYLSRCLSGAQAAEHFRVYAPEIKRALSKWRGNLSVKLKAAAAAACADRQRMGGMLEKMNRQATEENFEAWDVFLAVVTKCFPKTARAKSLDKMTVQDVAWFKTLLYQYSQGDDKANKMYSGAANTSTIADKYKLVFNEYCATERTERAADGGALLRADKARRAAQVTETERIEADEGDDDADFEDELAAANA
jgi:hypothetical protein